MAQQLQKVVVNVNGESFSVTLDEYEKMCSEFKKEYDALLAENQTFKNQQSNPNSNDDPAVIIVAYNGEQISACSNKYVL